MTTGPGRPCWCGEAARIPVGAHYRICEGCGTAVLAVPRPQGHVTVSDDEADFYGRRYWFDYQRARGYPDIESRSRSDLSERCVFWLKGVLEVVSPPGRTLEVGCGHGAFVRLLRELRRLPLDDPQRPAHLQAVLRTINGIAAGLQNTG